MNEQLWAGAEFKFQNAAYHLSEMQKGIERATIARAPFGAIPGYLWQEPFYAHLDAFLFAVRSIPEIIQCCFGYDTNSKMKAWWDARTVDEQDRRKCFTALFDYQTFRDHPLSTSRDVTAHRTGYSDAKVTINSMFGVTHIGTPVEHVPVATSRQFHVPPLPFLNQPAPLVPRWTDFEIAGQPLFETCQDYLGKAQALFADARKIANNVHGTQTLTPPW